jgi:hypothetical protein
MRLSYAFSSKINHGSFEKAERNLKTTTCVALLPDNFVIIIIYQWLGPERMHNNGIKKFVGEALVVYFVNDYFRHKGHVWMV